ncbi:MAG: VOC family protein, partial [Lysobacter sp.]
SGVIAQLRTTHLEQSIRFYTQTLGFVLDFRYGDFYAGIRIGEQLFHLKHVDQTDPSIAFVDQGGHFHLYIQTDDLTAAAERVRAHGVSFVEEPHSTDWATTEFVIHDDQGHTLYFGQTLAG